MDDSTFDPDDTTTQTNSNPLLNLSHNNNNHTSTSSSTTFTNSNATNNNTNTNITPLEQEILDEYTRLLNNMNQLQSSLQTLATGPITLEIADQLRLLERKVTSVYTLMKASVYSIVLQQGQIDDDDDDEVGDGRGVGGEDDG